MLKKIGQTLYKSKEELLTNEKELTTLKFDARDLVKLQGIQIEPEFLLVEDESQVAMQTELLMAIMNGFDIVDRTSGSK